MSSKYPRLERRGIFKGAFAINGGVGASAINGGVGASAINGGVGKNHFKNYIHLSLND
jgi:hypothetical protein